VDVRLTAEDGYQAQRSYSIASAPQDRELVLTVERLDDGEVSPYLTDVIEPGDALESGFVEAVADALVTLGHSPARIRTERFGPT
jgi:ferredoxin-NADP reductase